jgi:hypothetical protein
MCICCGVAWGRDRGGGADIVVGGRDDRGSVASLAANVAVAEPSAAGQVIAAWSSFVRSRDRAPPTSADMPVIGQVVRWAATLSNGRYLARDAIIRRAGLSKHLGVIVGAQFPARGNELSERVGDGAHVASRYAHTGQFFSLVDE